MTVCAHLRRCILGEVVGRGVILSEPGVIVHRCLFGLPEQFAGLIVDSHVIMPNHVHVLFGFRLPHPEATAPTLGAVVRHWKSTSSRLIRTGADASFGWQRNYFERVLRYQEEVERVRLYIAQNPARWDHDQENPAAQP